MVFFRSMHGSTHESSYITGGRGQGLGHPASRLSCVKTGQRTLCVQRMIDNLSSESVALRRSAIVCVDLVGQSGVEKGQ